MFQDNIYHTAITIDNSAFTFAGNYTIEIENRIKTKRYATYYA